MKTTLKTIVENYGFWFWLPALIGGAIDYLNQVQYGNKKWSILGFITHLASALFFGWFAGTIAAGLEYDVDIVAACGGMGGFLGVRVADLIAHRIVKIDRRGPE